MGQAEEGICWGMAMNKGRLVGVVLSSVLMGCGGASSFPLSIPRDPSIALRVEKALRWVDADRPPTNASTDLLEAAILVQIAQGAQGHIANAPGTRDLLCDDLSALEIKSRRYLTSYENKPAWHQVTVGVVDMPYGKFLSRFAPAADWGRNLASYMGGELTVDQWGEQGQATLQRERMVLKAPWYAITLPDLDMEKYEIIKRTADSTRIGWEVMASQNASVEIDMGYLVFRDVSLPDRRATLVAFNSVHRIATGIFPFRSDLVGDSIAGAFVSHIGRYRTVVQAPGLR